MPATTHELIGRGEELAEIVRLLDARERLPAVALMHGDAGIGKTSVWLVGIDAAAERGYRLLSCRPSEAETRLSYAGLSDLLGVVVDDVLSEIPAVQRRSLEAALLLGDVVTPVDERAVAASFLAALRVLAADGPLCVAVDDLQWLDAASAAALSFASSRLDGEPIATLVAVRGKPPSWLRRCLPGSSVVLEVGALSVGAVHELLRTRLGASFPRPTLIRLWETSAGNPFFCARAGRRAPATRGSAERPLRRTRCRSRGHWTSFSANASTASAQRHSKWPASWRRSPSRPLMSSRPPSKALPTPASPRRSASACRRGCRGVRACTGPRAVTLAQKARTRRTASATRSTDGMYQSSSCQYG